MSISCSRSSTKRMGVARPLLEKMGVTIADLRGRLTQELERRRKIQGGSYDQRIGNELRATIDAAEKKMAKLKDEFLSAEHYLLALADSTGAAAKLLKEAGITRDKLMQALQQVLHKRKFGHKALARILSVPAIFPPKSFTCLH